MFDIDYIIPCYGKSEIIRPGLLALANQWHKEFIHVVLVNDCSPNTDCDYQDLVDEFKSYIDIRSVRTDHNSGQGLCRQCGVDNTSHEYFMFQDEDDRLANPLAVSIFIGAVEQSMYKEGNIAGTFLVDAEGRPVIDKNKPKVGIVSGPLFEFDDQHTHVIESHNHVWVNSKLYNRKFIEKHNIRFNEAQSRHAEDYYFTSCFFFCLDNDPEYTGILLDNNQMTYLWWPNEESQSRSDPHYGFMLSGYTMDGSVNILKFMRDTKTHGIEWSDAIENTYVHNILNMTVYSYFNFFSFIKHIEETDYIPKLEQDWILLRDSCKKLQKLCKEQLDKLTYTEIIEEMYIVHHYSDVHWCPPPVAIDTYIKRGCDQFNWTYSTLMKHKEDVQNGKIPGLQEYR